MTQNFSYHGFKIYIITCFDRRLPDGPELLNPGWLRFSSEASALALRAANSPPHGDLRSRGEPSEFGRSGLEKN